MDSDILKIDLRNISVYVIAYSRDLMWGVRLLHGRGTFVGNGHTSLQYSRADRTQKRAILARRAVNN